MGTFEKIPISKIVKGERIRQENGDLVPLAASIKNHGLLNPITVCKSSDGMFLLLAGNRRLEACKTLGWPEIDANIIEIMEDVAN